MLQVDLEEIPTSELINIVTMLHRVLPILQGDSTGDLALAISYRHVEPGSPDVFRMVMLQGPTVSHHQDSVILSRQMPLGQLPQRLQDLIIKHVLITVELQPSDLSVS